MAFVAEVVVAVVVAVVAVVAAAAAEAVVVCKEAVLLHYLQDFTSSLPYFTGCTTGPLWRRGGLVASALDFRSGGRWFEPGHCRRVVSLDKKLYSTSSLFTQVYK